MSKKILIVDDSRSVRLQLSITLKRYGYTVIEATDGVKALDELAANEDITMIISDLNMPNLDGQDLVEIVKRLPEKYQVPIVILSSENSIEVIERAQAAGVDGWFIKPFKRDILIAAIEKLTASV